MYEIGDILTFYTMPEKEWLLLDYNDKVYFFVNLWDMNEKWTSQRKAPIHISVPLKHYKNRIKDV